ncbi:3-(3-hydroxyphenyl)propionate hydroxylase [Streptomyces libani subsp. rufus]|nr:3-(3-hydroxyphenyl)propionate hydroxylase [Streptomyces libani subsp. rufus]
MTTTFDGPQCDVIIVGAGPTGLTLARLLTMKDVRVAVVDPNRIACPHPRAAHIDDETMRVFQTVGAADFEPHFLRAGGWSLRGEDGTEFLSTSMPRGETGQGWNADYMFHQPDLESRLRGLLAVSDHADLWLGWQVTAVDQDDTHASVRMLDRTTGRTTTLRARYVVGADGAGSLVREQVQSEVEDLHGTQSSVIIDIHPFAHPAELSRTESFVLFGGDRPAIYVPMFPPKLRFEFLLRDNEEGTEFEDPVTVYRLLSPWLAPDSYRIQRTDVYTWHARLVRGWRNGRLLIAGDAAHLMPPMLGQGMCSGLRDVTNLAWKLARVVHDRSGPELLDTYEAERSPHVRPFIEESARQSNTIKAFAIPENRPRGVPPQVVERMRPPLGASLSDPAPPGAGLLAPQPRTGDGTLLDDVVGYNFAVVARPEVLAEVSDRVRAAWSALDAAVVALPGRQFADWLQEHDADAAIVRPDRYTYALTHGSAALEAASLALAERLAAEGAMV